MQSKLIASLLAVGLAATAFAAPESFELDPTHTYPTFEISHLGYSTMRGSFNDTTGKLTLDRAAKTGSLSAVVQIASLTTGFGKRDDHLKSKDFFNLAQFPTAEIKADKFTFEGDNPVKAEGTLTLLGVTKPITLAINQMKCEVRGMDHVYVCGGEVSTTIKRSDWGMKTFLPFIGDDVKIAVEVEADKK